MNIRFSLINNKVVNHKTQPFDKLVFSPQAIGLLTLAFFLEPFKSVTYYSTFKLTAYVSCFKIYFTDWDEQPLINYPAKVNVLI